MKTECHLYNYKLFNMQFDLPPTLVSKNHTISHRTVIIKHMSRNQPVLITLGDIVRLRKPHPCGSYEWEVIRLGADIGLICQSCGRKVMLSRGVFNKRLKCIVQRADEMGG